MTKKFHSNIWLTFAVTISGISKFGKIIKLLVWDLGVQRLNNMLERIIHSPRHPPLCVRTNLKRGNRSNVSLFSTRYNKSHWSSDERKQIFYLVKLHNFLFYLSKILIAHVDQMNTIMNEESCYRVKQGYLCGLDYDLRSFHVQFGNVLA